MCLGIPGKILAISDTAPEDPMRMGKVEFGGIARDVCLAYLPDVSVGDWVLVHVGFAISKIDEEEAAEIFSYIEQIGEMSEMRDPFDDAAAAKAQDGTTPGDAEERAVKYIDEYRDADATRRCADAIHRIVTRPWNLMEVCGGQTHAIVRFGLDELLPDEITLIHGPGCPVCVTPIEMIDKAIAIAKREEVIFCSYGDMLRVPGSDTDLLTVKSMGGDVRIVYSPIDAVKLASNTPIARLFFAIGFETTAPANVMAVVQADRLKLDNFSVLVSHVLVPPAIQAVLDSPRNLVQGFLAAGHVCAVMGTSQYQPIVDQYSVPIVVTGFEPLDILQGVYMCVRQLEEGRAELENQYARIVRAEGNPAAQRQVDSVFQTVNRKWRGIGEIPDSGWALREEYSRFDANERFEVQSVVADEPAECVAGEVLQGHRKPYECPVFGATCTPDTPSGAPMVSAEGACAAYYRYRRRR